VNRGKRRSLSQRLGTKGEYQFAMWATDRHLSPNKLENDFGIDYLSQVLEPVEESTSEEASGPILAAQIRAASGKSRPRVTLSREDATNLLRQTQATALIGIGEHPPFVSYLFLDEPFIDHLMQFLASPKESLSIRLDQMNSSVSEFDEKLAYLSRIGTQHRLRLYKTEKGLRSVIPGSLLSIQQSSDGGFALVEVPWIQSALQIETVAREKVRTLLFEQGQLPRALPGVSLRPELIRVQDLVDGPILLQGGIERDVELTARRGTASATAIFHARPLSDETAYSHPAGFALVLSGRRKHGDVWVHEFELRTFKGGTDTLSRERSLSIPQATAPRV
jgi:hypothetical protein